jgi:hypothetical protein
MKLLSLVSLRGISGQIAALVVASVVALHLIITASFLIHRPDQPDPSTDRRHGQLATAAQLLGSAPASERARLIGDIAHAFPQLGIAELAADRAPVASDISGPDLHALRRLGPHYQLFALPPAGERPPNEGEIRRIGIRLPDGAMIAANLLPDQHSRPFWGPWMITALFAVISVTLLGLWAARALTAPLSSFAKAAETFSLNGAAAGARTVGDPLGCESAQPDARAHHCPDRRPHHQPRSAHADHADAAARRIHRGRDQSPAHAARP